MTHHKAVSLGAFLAALLLASPAWADGGGAGSDKFGGVTIQYDDSDDGSDDGGATGTPEDDQSEYDYRAIQDFLASNPRFAATTFDSRRFSTTTRLKGEITFNAGLEEFGTSDEDLSGGNGLTYRTRLNFDTSFTGEDRLRVRLQASDAKGFAKQGKAPTVRSVDPPTFGQTEYRTEFSTEPKYTFSVGGSWGLWAEYDQDAYSDGYITGERVPGQRNDFEFSPQALFGSSEPVRYASPTIAGFVLSADWDEDSATDVALRYANEFGAIRVQNGTAEPLTRGVQYQGGYGSLTFHPERAQILKNVELIPNELLTEEFKDYKFDRGLDIRLQGFSGSNGRGTQSEFNRADAPIDPRRYFVGARLRF